MQCRFRKLCAIIIMFASLHLGGMDGDRKEIVAEHKKTVFVDCTAAYGEDEADRAKKVENYVGLMHAEHRLPGEHGGPAGIVRKYYDPFTDDQWQTIEQTEQDALDGICKIVELSDGSLALGYNSLAEHPIAIYSRQSQRVSVGRASQINRNVSFLEAFPDDICLLGCLHDPRIMLFDPRAELLTTIGTTLGSNADDVVTPHAAVILDNTNCMIATDKGLERGDRRDWRRTGSLFCTVRGHMSTLKRIDDYSVLLATSRALCFLDVRVPGKTVIETTEIVGGSVTVDSRVPGIARMPDHALVSCVGRSMKVWDGNLRSTKDIELEHSCSQLAAVTDRHVVYRDTWGSGIADVALGQAHTLSRDYIPAMALLRNGISLALAGNAKISFHNPSPRIMLPWIMESQRRKAVNAQKAEQEARDSLMRDGSDSDDMRDDDIRECT